MTNGSDSDFPAEPYETRLERKISEIHTKSGVELFGNSDYRGVIAIILVISFIFSLFEDKVAAMVLGPFAGVVITWYFKEWNSHNGKNRCGQG